MADGHWAPVLYLAGAWWMAWEVQATVRGERVDVAVWQQFLAVVLWPVFMLYVVLVALGDE